MTHNHTSYIFIHHSQNRIYASKDMSQIQTQFRNRHSQSVLIFIIFNPPSSILFLATLSPGCRRRPLPVRGTMLGLYCKRRWGRVLSDWVTLLWIMVMKYVGRVQMGLGVSRVSRQLFGICEYLWYLCRLSYSYQYEALRCVAYSDQIHQDLRNISRVRSTRLSIRM